MNNEQSNNTQDPAMEDFLRETLQEKLSGAPSAKMGACPTPA